jgi:Protein of unknown function (DUF3592)
MGIGVFALYALKGSRQQRAEMLNWPSVEGHVTDRSLQRTRGAKGGAVYTPVLLYTYAVDGVEYNGDTRKLAWSSGWNKSIAKRKLYAVPDDVPVLYNPADPASSALEPPSRGSLWFWAAIGVVLIALGLYLLVT